MPKTHIVPTHLRTPETVLTLGGLSLSARQFLLLLLGSALGYDLWLHLVILAHVPAGQVVRLLLALIPFAVSCVLAFVRLAGRELIAWLLVVVRFGNRPRRLVWRSVRILEPSLVLDGTAETEEEDA
ncbi:MAG: hypothetical protein ABI234_04430 [Ktedonobacteraceae bacterium]